MTKADLRILERLFDAEIVGLLPAQLRSKRLAQLRTDGYVEEMTVTFPGRFPIMVTGWCLTHLGRYVYCESCGDDDFGDDES